MTTPVRFWRLYFRSINTYNYGQLIFRTLKPHDASGNPLTSGVSLSISAGLMNGTSFPLANLIDIDTASATYCGVNYPDYQTTTSWRFVQFTYTDPVLWDFLLANISETALNGNSVVPANSVDFCIDSSPDNVTWNRQAMVYRPVLAANGDYKFSATTKSTTYPIPSRINIGGSGGIYGIVSEDGVAQADRPVLLFERDTFYKVGYTTTDQNGGYAFNGLNENREFLVMSYDPSGPPYKNALVWDRILPINTKGNLAPQSAFWARRCRESSLGMLVSYADYLNGATYRYFRSNILGHAENMLQTTEQFWGFDFYPDTRVGGSIRFLKSGRHLSPTANNNGLFIRAGQGAVNGRNQASPPENYTNLTWEYIFKAPAPSETALIFMWGGRRDSDDHAYYGYDDYWGYYGMTAGPTLEVTSAVMNVRLALSTRNLSIVRASAPVVAGEIYHVMVTYEQDATVKLYVNGVLVQTTAITGGGRLWSWLRSNNPTNENWDYIATTNQPNGAARRFDALAIGGYGTPTHGHGSGWGAVPAAHGGGFGLAAMYYRTFTDAEVASFYDSYQNWDTHVVPPKYAGYMAEIEADNPVYYFRMNELQSQRPINALGQQDYFAWYEGNPVFNATGFVTGSSAITTSNGSLLLNNFSTLATTFTVECFVRPSSVTGTTRIWLLRIYNGNPPMYLSLVAGNLQLSIVDVTGTTTTVFFVHPNLVAGTAYHLAVTYDPWGEKKTRLYINGVQANEQTATVFPDTYRTATWLCIGANASATAPTISERFQGQIGEFAAYNYVLPPARVQAHYDARNT